MRFRTQRMAVGQTLDRRNVLSRVAGLAIAGTLCLVAPWAAAQTSNFPSRPIHLVVTYGPGSAPDIIGRLVASDAQVHLGQPIVVENKPGAGGSIGIAAVARANADGYTIGIATASTHGINPVIIPNIPYDPIRDFVPVAMLATTANVLLVSPNSPSKSVEDLMRLMKTRDKDNGFKYNSIGIGTTQHLLGALLARKAGASALHVPYRPVAEQVNALNKEEIDYGFATRASSLGAVKSGQVRVLAIASARPSTALPGVSTLGALGIDGFDKADLWFGVLAPKGTPDAVIQVLHRAFAKALTNPAITEKIGNLGFEPAAPMSPSELGKFIVEQVGYWAGMVKASGISVN